MTDKMKTRKKSSKKRQFFLFALCSLLAMSLCIATLVITVKNIDGDSNSSINVTEQIESKTQIKGETNELSEYLFGLTSDAQNSKFIKVNSFTDINVDDGSIIITDENGAENSADKNLFIYAKNYFLPLADGIYGEDITGVFGENTGVKPIVSLTATDDVKSEFSVGAADESGEPVLNEDGTVTDGDFYFINLTVNGADVKSEQEKSTFRVADLSEKIEGVEEKIAPGCEITNTEISPLDFNVNAKVNRITDRIEYIEIRREYNIKADFNFINELSLFGKKQVEFKFGVTHRYEYFYAGIDLAETELTVGENEEAALTVNAVLEDYSDYTVVFESSDPSVATVDEMGYVKGVRTDKEPVVITVELNYLGETFTDQCTVFVGDGENAGEAAQ
ncbi:MAG: Ig-like domain-containing protein [Clostridia bacterium]|nr:Ig-like domain-containing protein [Clostridia bacterium]